MSMAQEFDPIRLLHALHERGVLFVVIGGVAARAHGSPSATTDLDVCYERSPANLDRLAQALRTVHATLRGVEPGLPFRLDARTLQMGDHFTLVTELGDLDCLGTPAGTDGFNELSRNAVLVDFDGVAVRFASLDDLMTMKRAAGRPKDRVELEILEALRQELDRERESN